MASVFAEKIVEVGPVAFLAVSPVVALCAVLVDLFAGVSVNPLVEIVRLELVAWVFVAPLAQGSLPLLQAVLLLSGTFHVPLFQPLLVWPDA